MADYKNIKGASIISIDTETYDPDLKADGPGDMRDDTYLLGVSLGTEDGWCEYYNLGHPDVSIVEREHTVAYLKDMLSADNIKIGCNIQYDLSYLRTKLGIIPAGTWIDIMNAEFYLDEYRDSYSLESLAMKYLDEHKKNDTPVRICEENDWKGDFRKHLWKMNYKDVYEYGKGDAIQPIRIFEKQRVQLEKEGVWDAFTIESDMLQICQMLRHKGIRVDRNKRDIVNNELKTLLDQKQTEFTRKYGEVNLNSHKQKKEFFRAQGIPIREVYDRESGTWKETIRKEDLDRLAPQYPVCADIRLITRMGKMYSSFTNGSLVKYDYNGRIHGVFYNTKSDDASNKGLRGTKTSRFSAAYPNLEQIPALRGDIDKDPFDYWFTRLARSVFLPEENEDFCSVDLSSAELRMFAHYCVAPKGSNAARDFRQSYIDQPDLDLHTYIAMLVWNDKSYRKIAKTLMFSSMYGSSAKHIAEVFNMSKDKAKAIYDTFHAKFPVIKATGNFLVDKAKERATSINWQTKEIQGAYINTLGGRRARLINLNDGYKMLNKLVQGSVADYYKKALQISYRAGIFNSITLLNLVHDEALTSTPRTKEGYEAFQELHHNFCTAYKLSVPVLSQPEIGPRWSECEEIYNLEAYKNFRISCPGCPKC